MSGPSIGSVLALSWCDLCVLMADSEDGPRRREEYRSHVADARGAGVGEWRLMAEAFRGALDDVRWCSESRMHAGRPSLSRAVVLERDLAVVAMTVAMAMVFVVSLFPILRSLQFLLLVAATGLLSITAARAALDRFRRGSRNSNDS